jgi:hypothetical protein
MRMSYTFYTVFPPVRIMKGCHSNLVLCNSPLTRILLLPCTVGRSRCRFYAMWFHLLHAYTPVPPVICRWITMGCSRLNLLCKSLGHLLCLVFRSLPLSGQMWTPEEWAQCTIGRALTRLTWTGHRERSDVLSLCRPVGSDLEKCSL